jgi:hypothetical protein
VTVYPFVFKILACFAEGSEPETHQFYSKMNEYDAVPQCCISGPGGIRIFGWILDPDQAPFRMLMGTVSFDTAKIAAPQHRKMPFKKVLLLFKFLSRMH